jgi:RluA family pseudouridine synthase
MNNPPAVEILYEQGPCLVVFKPAGLLTQAPPGIDSMEVRIKTFLKHRDHKPGKVYLGVPHRLDRPVSGAMLFAKNARACRRLCDQFQGRIVKKFYWACTTGKVVPDQGTWADSVRKIPGEARAEVVPATHPDGRDAVLHYETLSLTPVGSCLKIQPETGRTHQIRVQAASRGYPVLGDELYGSTIPFGPQPEDHRLRAIALHGQSLTFFHPMTHEQVTVEAPLPEPWNAILGQSP